MMFRFCFAIFLLILSFNVFSQKWRLVKSSEIASVIAPDFRAKPLKSEMYYIDYQQWSRELASVGFRSSFEINLPDTEGKVTTYFIKEEVIMEKELAVKYPGIKVYEGYNEGGTKRIRMDIGAYGLNAIITHTKGTEFISPVYNTNQNYYHVYHQKDAPMSNMNAYCGTNNYQTEVIRHTPQSLSELRSASYQKLQYRFAVACTGEWGRLRGTVEKALSDIVTATNILNAIFEVDLGMKLILTGKNDSLIFLDPATDPYIVANEGRSILTTSTGIINQRIGVNSYDLGHVFTNSCTDVGGVANLGVICGGGKGNGVSCIGNNLTRGVTQIVAHEIGHQLGARHTFHSCGDNRSAGNDFEPGSGSTIMSYGGLCNTQNIVTTNDTYFHQASLNEIFRVIRRPEAAGFSCAEKIPSSNLPPVINTMPSGDLTIPKSTPFILQAKVSDPNNDNLTYCWEQKDSSIASSTPLGSPAGNAPLFRSYPPSADDYRIFPRPSSLLTNKMEIAEVLPTYARNMNFALSVRDNNHEASATVWALTSLKVDAGSGPFKITSQNETFTAQSGSSLNLTWDVANTDQAPVNCKAVDIFLSLDGELAPGHPKVIPLATSTPNDGNEVVIIPNTATVTARIIVKASNNVFFDVSDVYFSIIEGNNPRSFYEFPFVNTELCLPATSQITLKSRGISNYAGKIKYEITQLPKGATASFSKNEVKVGEDVTLNVMLPNEIATGRYTLEIRGTGEAKDTLIRTLTYDLVSNNFTELTLQSPQNSTKNAGVLPEFNWNPSSNAEYYQIQVATSPAFETSAIIYQDTTTFSSIRPKKTLNRGTLYYWRIRPQNSCGFGPFTQVFTYGTVVSNCQTYNSSDLPINLSATGRPVAEAKVNIDVDFDISDVNVKKLNITHDNFRDLVISLKSPKDTTAVLVSRQCPRRMTLDAGFDDEAPNFFSCINGTDLQFKAQDSLSRFKKTSPRGQWTLRVEDAETGNGGRVNNFILEVCGDIPVENPDLTIGKTLEVIHLQNKVISADYIKSTDKNSGSADLSYTLVSKPLFGNITLNDKVIEISNKFTQEDIDAGRLKYVNTLPGTLSQGQSLKDSLGLVVQNNANGFDGIKYLPVTIAGVSTNTFTIEKGSLIITPNPTATAITIVLPDGFEYNSRLKIYQLTGELLLEMEYLKNEQLDISNIKSGVYIIELTSGNKKAFGKVLKIN
jgi:subtilisin-like proprotein convertase family protein